ncbi:hypothetical protein IBL38_21210 [Pseudomonas syringae pv. syringae]|uniref:hypothetical protein n=1 Tax=Pseudomonas syringae TaxID=317 RepID=UPI0016595AA9|nr:hypothetical protein [Pseudomonas syringae]MBC9744484.1 hypothetical protein [Pseudomonas syringae pv. syringae]MBC9749814.1 hypothetical protein [Pseudomonas syringae pv. syringae]MCH5655026.1 hypothetical protein [Pseudomonas syringae]MCK9709298.1 hypothetical protein [Pseudomonas syringae pv. syringae]MCK9724791.1 hypothetical protein [Pseudomonas syringae pv. syringae]
MLDRVRSHAGEAICSPPNALFANTQRQFIPGPNAAHTFPAPICYLPPQNCAKSHSGNNVQPFSEKRPFADQKHQALINKALQIDSMGKKQRQHKVGLLIAYACMYK